jgi:uncharacterized protein (TIGR03000 family)
MFRHSYFLAGLLGMAVAAALFVANPASAQQGWPLNQGSYNGYTEGGSSAGPVYAAPSIYAGPTYAPLYQPAVAAPTTPQAEVRSFYPSAAAEEYGTLSTPFAGNQPVWINMSVPANAQITFNGAKTRQTGAMRAFVSPPLAPGRDYYYDVTAKWEQGGREVTRTRHIAVQAGDVINVTF